MIYVDASQLFRFIKAGKPVTGIQRLTLMSLMGLQELLGDEKVRPMVFDIERNCFVAASVSVFFAKDLSAFQPADFASEDKLLFIEWYWNQQAFEASLQAGKSVGAQTFRFMHDVIPVARPDLVRNSLTQRFRANTSRALLAADHVLTNSDFSRADILKHFSNQMAGKPIDVLKLPHEFTIVDPGGLVQKLERGADIPITKLRPSIAALAEQKFALMVGTLEPRKNSLEVVKAWSRLASQHRGNMPKLVAVGFYSAHRLLYTASLVVQLRLRRSLLHLDNCSDSELAWLYRHCQFGIYASQYEGWGLPIGESLWFEKPVIAQQVSSMPEVGGMLTDYADVGDLPQFSTTIEKLTFSAEYRSRRIAEISNAKLRDWKEFATEMAQVLAR